MAMFSRRRFTALLRPHHWRQGFNQNLRVFRQRAGASLHFGQQRVRGQIAGIHPQRERLPLWLKRSWITGTQGAGDAAVVAADLGCRVQVSRQRGVKVGHCWRWRSGWRNRHKPHRGNELVAQSGRQRHLRIRCANLAVVCKSLLGFWIDPHIASLVCCAG